MIPLLLALLAACERSPGPAEAAALELCRWGQLSTYQLRMVPESAGLEPLVREADLRWLKQQRALEDAAPEGQNPLRALARGLVESIAAMGAAMTEASARHARCSAELLHEDEATVRLRVTREVPDITPADPKARSAEMAAHKTHEARVEALSALMARAGASEVEVVEVTLVRQGEGWAISYGLPEAALARAEATVKEAEQKLALLEGQAATLARVTVTEARFVTRREGMLQEQGLRLGLSNGLEQTLTAGLFVGRVQAGGEVPGQREFDLALPAPLAPGAQAAWDLYGNAFRALAGLAAGRPDAVVEVEVLELRGEGPDPIASLRDRVVVEGELARARAEVEALRQALPGGAPK